MHKIIAYFRMEDNVKVAILAVAVLAIFATQCEESTTVHFDYNQDKTGCITHADCPVGYSCAFSEGLCEKDPNTTVCLDSSDCSAGYCCYHDSGKCIPEDGSLSCGADGDSAKSVDGDNDQDRSIGCPPCKKDEDCKNPAYVCCFDKCEEKNSPCQDTRDCLPAQTCEKNICQGEPNCTPFEDGDLDTDKEVEPDKEPEADEEPEPEYDGKCTTSADCPEDKVCGPDGECVPRCDTAGAAECPDPQHCNPQNGYCECCETLCASNRCCNRAESGFWYCGQCCTPPCPSDQVCQGGVCVPLRCTECEHDCCECSAYTCWVCDCWACGHGDDDSDLGKGACLPANSACKEGIDHCCSGTCMMGTCL